MRLDKIVIINPLCMPLNFLFNIYVTSFIIFLLIILWQDVYFPTQLEAHHIEFCSSRKSILSAGRSESNSISSPFSA